jgi:hypothetical protein
MRYALLLVALVIAAGCTDQPAKSDRPKKATKESHPSKGPHGGALAEWGEENYHAEFTVDHAKKQVIIYILDGSAKKAEPVAADTLTLTISNVKPPVQVTLKADPQDGDPKGQSSRFRGTHDALGTEMEFEGEIAGTVGGTPFSGEFKEKADGGHKHNKER